MEEVTTRPIKDDELLVEMVASGICHTDILLGSIPATPPMFFYPRVLGHEGKRALPTHLSLFQMTASLTKSTKPQAQATSKPSAPK